MASAFGSHGTPLPELLLPQHSASAGIGEKRDGDVKGTQCHTPPFQGAQDGCSHSSLSKEHLNLGGVRMEHGGTPVSVNKTRGDLAGELTIP